MSALAYYQRGLATEARCRDVVEQLRNRGALMGDEGDVLEGWIQRTFVSPEPSASLIQDLIDQVEEAIDTIESIHIETGPLYKLQGRLERIRDGREE